MSWGMSTASARSPSAKRSAGSAPGPPLCPGTWNRPVPRNAWATSASRYGALGCSEGWSSGMPGRRYRLLPAPQQLCTHEPVEIAVEHALGVADLEVRAVVLDHR